MIVSGRVPKTLITDRGLRTGYVTCRKTWVNPPEKKSATAPNAKQTA